ncbi:hypothetical protein [Paenibacillus sp. FSL L8-0709]|uniref:hypothetical protein n=1 Tax=Paenibacillus sp. FSL L8-0709 TaxID=2975312 RepID=UPI0030FA3CDC
MKFLKFILLSVILTLSLTACETTSNQTIAKATETEATETEATETEATETEATETEATETEAAETEATETEATETEATEIEPTETEPTETKATETEATPTVESSLKSIVKNDEKTNAIVKSSLLEAIEKEQYGLSEKVTDKDIETVLNVDGSLEIWVHNSFIITPNAKDTVQFHDIAMYTFIYSSQEIFGTQAYQNVSNIRLVQWNGATDKNGNKYKQEDFRVAISKEYFDNINWKKVLEKITSKYDKSLFTEWYWNVRN